MGESSKFSNYAVLYYYDLTSKKWTHYENTYAHLQVWVDEAAGRSRVVGVRLAKEGEESKTYINSNIAANANFSKLNDSFYSLQDTAQQTTFGFQFQGPEQAVQFAAVIEKCLADAKQASAGGSGGGAKGNIPPAPPCPKEPLFMPEGMAKPVKLDKKPTPAVEIKTAEPAVKPAEKAQPAQPAVEPKKKPSAIGFNPAELKAKADKMQAKVTTRVESDDKPVEKEPAKPTPKPTPAPVKATPAPTPAPANVAPSLSSLPDELEFRGEVLEVVPMQLMDRDAVEELVDGKIAAMEERMKAWLGAELDRRGV